jgi:hypothetical protein
MIIILKRKATPMKKLSFLFNFFLFTSATFAQANLQALVKPGTKLIYAVEANEQRYDFIVTVKKLTPGCGIRLGNDRIGCRQRLYNSYSRSHADGEYHV